MSAIVRRADFRVVPWKNGRGFTTEVAVEPAGATLATGFDWRVSMASVTEDGPFSSFPGIDRTLVLLEGDGLMLESPDGTLALRERFALARFDGGAPITGRLAGGPVRDLNVMVRRDAYAHAAEVVALGAPRTLGPAPTLIVIALDGHPTLDGEALAPGELWRGQRCVAAGPGALLVVTLTPR